MVQTIDKQKNSASSYLLLDCFVPPKVNEDAPRRHRKTETCSAGFQRTDQDTCIRIISKLLDVSVPLHWRSMAGELEIISLISLTDLNKTTTKSKG